jgi:hypothetical protein
MGLAGLCAVFAEQSGLDWSAVYVHTVLGHSASRPPSGPHPARSIAGVAGIAYGSGLIAPGVIGGIADLSSLRVSYGLVVLLTAAIAAGAGVLRSREKTPVVARSAEGA